MSVHMQRKQWTLWAVCLLVSLPVLGCFPAGLFSEPSPTQPPQPEPIQPPPQPQPPQPQPPVTIDLVGIWESQITTDYGPMYTHMILQRDGSYSYQVVWGDAMTWEVGIYEVGAGFIHFAVQDYEPKEYMGQQISRPTSWTVFYTVVDENTMIWEDRVLGHRWTVYRQR